MKEDMPRELSDELLEVLTTKSAALVTRSVDILEGLLDPNFTYVNSHGQRLNRSQYIDLCCGSKGLQFQGQTYSQFFAQDFESFALATMLVHDQFLYEGRSVSGAFQSFCVFRKTAGHWLWAGGQTMSLPDKEVR